MKFIKKINQKEVDGILHYSSLDIRNNLGLSDGAFSRKVSKLPCEKIDRDRYLTIEVVKQLLDSYKLSFVKPESATLIQAFKQELMSMGVEASNEIVNIETQPSLPLKVDAPKPSIEQSPIQSTLLPSKQASKLKRPVKPPSIKVSNDSKLEKALQHQTGILAVLILTITSEIFYHTRLLNAVLESYNQLESALTSIVLQLAILVFTLNIPKINKQVKIEWSLGIFATYNWLMTTSAFLYNDWPTTTIEWIIKCLVPLAQAFAIWLFAYLYNAKVNLATNK